MRKYIFYLDGQYLKAEQGLLDVFTPGRIRWHGAFETMCALDGKVEWLEEHLQRLLRGLKALRVRHHYTLPALKRIVRRVARRNPSIKLGRLRAMVFEAGHTVHCAVMMLDYQPLSSEQYRAGLKVSIIKTKRPATARWADVKSLDYGLFASAYDKARSSGYDEALLVNAKGHVFEASRANIFILSGGTLITPPLTSGCLDGIVRRQVMAFARRFGIPVLEKDLTVPVVRSAQGIFLTNSMVGMVPVARVAR